MMEVHYYIYGSVDSWRADWGNGFVNLRQWIYSSLIWLRISLLMLISMFFYLSLYRLIHFCDFLSLERDIKDESKYFPLSAILC